MTGIIDMGNNKIIDLKNIDADSTNNMKYAVNRYYVDNTFLKLAGGEMDGDIDMGNNKIIDLKDIDTTSTDNDNYAVNKKYVD